MLSLSAWRSHSRRWIFVVSPLLGFLLVYHLLRADSDSYISLDRSEDHDHDTEPIDPACRYLRGMDDVLVVLKTGVTEALDKVPVHVNTTLRCLPHYAIFSDHEEEIAGVLTVDVLRNVSDTVKQSNPDFAIYNRVHDRGRQGLLAADVNDDVNGPFGKPGNPGWKLDKWKFLPMIDEALQARPSAKWYVFVEADTYVVWPNLVAWLSNLDHNKPYYMGNPMQIAGTLFAYGGSGIVMSNPALKKLSEYRAQRVAELDEYTGDELNWAGDCILGKVLSDAGVSLLWSWPMLQSSRVWEMDHFGENYGRKPWCYPAVSYHHMSPADIETLWSFEQEWFGEGQHSLLLHRDVFNSIVGNETFAEHDNWDNLSSEEVHAGQGARWPISAAECPVICAEDPTCLQYSYNNGKCLTAQTVFRGSSRSAVYSGWMRERITAILKDMSSCAKVNYVTR